MTRCNTSPTLDRISPFQSPQKPKGDCDLERPSEWRQVPSLFQSPQKPKGDCDFVPGRMRDFMKQGSNHPKSRKAIVTKIGILNIPKRSTGSNHPKSRKAIVTRPTSDTRRESPRVFQSPQKPKGDCDYQKRAVSRCTEDKFQSPQKPKGDCDSLRGNSRDLINLGVPITPKAERRL